MGVSSVQLRTHWAIELAVGTLNLEKEENCNIPFILSLLQTFALLLLLSFLRLLVLYNDVTIALNNDVTATQVDGHEHGHVSTDRNTIRTEPCP